MGAHGVINGLENSRANAPLMESMRRTAASLKKFQQNRIETTIAFQKAVLKAAGYGNHVDMML
jgi:uncharacterized MAPEG superfamily protein